MAALHKSAPPGWRVHKPKGYVIRITNTEDGVRCDFLNIPPGSYAIAVIHNVNMDGALETNFRGVSKKGYGISNGVKGMIGDSSFSAASFLYDKKNLDMPISLRYRRLLLKIPIVIRNPDPSLSAMAACELLAHVNDQLKFPPVII